MNTRFCTRRLVAAIVATFLLIIPCFGQINENFDSYPLGSIDGQGPWVDFGGTLPPEVSDDRSVSPNNSLKITQNPEGLPNFPGYGSDVFLDLPSAIDTGKHRLSYSIYVQNEFDGTAHMFVSEGAVGANDFDFGMQLVADRLQGFQIYFDGAQAFGLPLVIDQWVDVVANIDLDNNAVDVSYGGDPLFVGAWDPNGPNAPSLRGINIWAQDGVGTGSVYFDNLVLEEVPEPGSFCLLAFGILSLVGLRHRR